MYCWRCGAEIQGGTCMVCGCSQDTRRKAESSLGTSLRYVYDKFGPERILTDGDTLRRCLSDILPDERHLRQQIAAVMQTSVGRMIFELLRSGREPGAADCQTYIRIIHTECGLTEPIARDVLNLLIDMIGCANPLTASKANQNPTNIRTIQPPVPSPNTPKAVEISRNPQSGPAVIDMQILATLHGVYMVDATSGIRGNVNTWKNTSKFCVRTDGIAVHNYQGSRLMSPEKRPHSKDPDTFIPRGEIVRVIENFFPTVHEFTIVTRDGKRYRVLSTRKREFAVNAISAIRSIIQP